MVDWTLNLAHAYKGVSISESSDPTACQRMSTVTFSHKQVAYQRTIASFTATPFV